MDSPSNRPAAEIQIHTILLGGDLRKYWKKHRKTDWKRTEACKGNVIASLRSAQLKLHPAEQPQSVSQVLLPTWGLPARAARSSHTLPATWEVAVQPRLSPGWENSDSHQVCSHLGSPCPETLQGTGIWAKHQPCLLHQGNEDRSLDRGAGQGGDGRVAG